MTPEFLAWAEAGFGAELIPVCGPSHSCASPGKRPHLTGWQEATITPEHVAAWASRHDGNIGLRTRTFPALDLDIEDAEIADACEMVALVRFGSTARRTRANTSRRLLLYGLEGVPFEKRTVRFTMPGGERGQVEILADGQQVVVAGVHHTGAAIEWRSGQPSAPGLAPMSAGSRDAFVMDLRRRLAELGCVVDESPASVRRATRPTAQRTDLDTEIAEMALQRLDPDMPYEAWFRVGMALHARWPDENGLALWDAWSAHGEKYPGMRELSKHWASFHAGKGVGFGTLIVMARRAGR